MDKLHEIVEGLNLENNLTIEEMPDIDLYMDQVIQLFESKFARSKRNEDEKILTKTMINNYAKGKLFFPIKNKKYSKEHLILIGLIYQMKGALSIKDIKIALDQLNDKVSKDEISLEEFYRSYLHLSQNNQKQFMGIIEENTQEVERQVSLFEDKDNDYLEKLLLATTFVNMSNYYRRAAEKMIDEINKEQETE
ncbi:protein of unknown function [Oceanobacillus limi]|uniref:DUF1836 domain-containing protein n=1 Tax=Oceanobacillus limi TaxID=930131 RepID=A0A1I0DTS8_9BACI|nr:DUF1836 domain-containing protein [Oceanobacillus limi]SET35713.1 protein of unknown function [Oceanobacillus limi]